MMMETTAPPGLQRIQGFVWADSTGHDWHVWLDGSTLFTDAQFVVTPGGTTIYQSGPIASPLVEVTGPCLTVNYVNIFAGVGAPSVGLGTDNSYYLRSDGGSLSTMYHKRSGAWVGVV